METITHVVKQSPGEGGLVDPMEGPPSTLFIEAPVRAEVWSLYLGIFFTIFGILVYTFPTFLWVFLYFVFVLN